MPLPINWAEILRPLNVSTRPRCPDHQLSDAEVQLGHPLPSELRALLAETNGLFDPTGQWYLVWPVDRIVSATQELRADPTSGFPARLLAFGDDGTGSPFCAPTDGTAGIEHWSAVSADTRLLAESLEAFLIGWLSGSISV